MFAEMTDWLFREGWELIQNARVKGLDEVFPGEDPNTIYTRHTGLLLLAAHRLRMRDAATMASIPSSSDESIRQQIKSLEARMTKAEEKLAIWSHMRASDEVFLLVGPNLKTANDG